MKKFLIILFFIQTASAESGWYCEGEAAARNGNIYAACGVGEGMDESYARQRALNFAIAEFSTICELSSDCAEKPRTFEPKRTTCNQGKTGIWKCYRMIEITVGR